MIELKHITKIYRGTGSSSVIALDDISIRFPEKGLVFIIGKSGCGKSTLLNIAGGLDRPTSGEISVGGKSSRDFSQSDYDSYRNTYVGFIFQEYNVLPEFSVMENITLAPELQGKKSTPEEIGGILSEVELDGLEKRSPSTLSGGQKQRVAIARALVKDPRIVLADEPTGALDSVTGRSVLDLLKRLSEDKLVIVVSHDRDFANKYADRIIELHDGKIISDMSFIKDEEKRPDMAVVGDDVHLSSEIRESMLEELNRLVKDKKKLTITLEEGGVSVEGGYFAPTDQESLIREHEDEGNLIRSKFPLRYAAKMGASGLRTKPFRLAMTILLTTVALAAFGFMLSLMNYDRYQTLKNALADTGHTELSLATYRVEKPDWLSTIFGDFSYDVPVRSDSSRIEIIKNKTGLDFVKVQKFYTPEPDSNFKSMFYFGGTNSEGKSSLFTPGLCGFSALTESEMEKFGISLVSGSMPKDSDDILISEFAAESIYELEAKDGSGEPILKEKNDSPVGKTVVISGVKLRICGIFSGGRPGKVFDYIAETEELMKDNMEALYLGAAFAEYGSRLMKYLNLTSKLESVFSASFMTLGIVDESFFDAHEEEFQSHDTKYVISLSNGTYLTYDTTDHISDYDTRFMNGAAAGPGGLLISPDYLYTIVYEYYSSSLITENLQTELLDSIRSVNDSGGYNYDIDACIAVLETLKSIDPSLFNGSVGYTSPKIGDSSVPLSVKGVFISSDIDYNRADLLIDPTDADKLYPPRTGSFDLSSADVLLFLNDEKSRETVTDSRFDAEDTMMIKTDLYANSHKEDVNTYSTIISIVSGILFWTGTIIAVFAALLLFNFISVSINNKKKDIGILRALGARKIDVFKVFFSESLIIIGICFAVSTVLAILASEWFNSFLMESFSVSARLFFFGPLQALILLALALGVAFIATLLPVIHHSKKPPVDAIRSL